MLTEEQVRHVAKLARVELTDEEVKKFTTQLSGVLDYMDILSELNTDGVDETSQVTGLKNMFRKDEVVDFGVSREELLDCTELPVDTKQIRVKKTI